jgi:hypothetical protein
MTRLNSIISVFISCSVVIKFSMVVSMISMYETFNMMY